MRDWSDNGLTQVVWMQAGLPLPGVEVSIRGGDGAETPRDGKTLGDLFVRGPWIIDGYFKGEGAEQFSADGWFRTGDMAIASPEGYFVIGDRDHLQAHGFASWQLPDRIELIEVVPKTSVGKFDKKVLRARFATML